MCMQSCSYNMLVSEQEKVNEAWSNVENQYQRRSDLIPNLVATVKGYAQHEKELLEKVNKEVESIYESKYGLSFAEAFVLLKNGKCVRRASWLGYWEPQGENILMKCKDGRVFDMSKGCSPMFTLSNTLAHDWVYVDEAHKAELDKIHAAKLLLPAADQAKAEKILAEGK